MCRMEVSGLRIRAGAGVESTRLSAIACERGLTGVEFMHCLPGSVGGAAFMNARAFGQEMSRILRRAEVVDRQAGLRVKQTDPADFSYKHSPFMAEGLVVTEVELELDPGSEREIREKMEANERHRRSKGEMDHPSCGCVFKNPTGGDLSAGGIIDRCGLKGSREGSAWVSEQHANFVVHDGKATPLMIRTLMERVRETVKREAGVELGYEVRFLGDW